jgi:primosomal protein N'
MLIFDLIFLTIPQQRRTFIFFMKLYKTTQRVTSLFRVSTPTNTASVVHAKKNEELFHEQDAIYRKQYHYPPFSDLCVLLYKHEIEERLYTNVDKLYKELLYYKEKYQLENIEIYTTPPLIYKKFGKFRYNIVLKWDQLRNFIDIIYSKCNINGRWFKIDRQADSIV